MAMQTLSGIAVLCFVPRAHTNDPSNDDDTHSCQHSGSARSRSASENAGSAKSCCSAHRHGTAAMSGTTQSDFDFGFFSGHLVIQAQSESRQTKPKPQAQAQSTFQLLGTPSPSPPQPHDCFKRDYDADPLVFWDICVRSKQHNMEFKVHNVLHRSSDAVHLSTRLDPAVFSDLPDSDSECDMASKEPQQGQESSVNERPCLEFSAKTVHVDGDAVAAMRKFFPGLAPDPRSLVCIGPLSIKIASSSAV